MLAVVRRVLVLSALVAGCTADAVDVELVLREGDCTPPDLAQIRVLSVEVYGYGDGDETLCTLDKRCVFDLNLPETPIASVDDLEDALRAQQQPLIDTARAGAEWVGIVGRSEPSCWKQETYPLCGLADLQNVSDGRLEVRLSCDCTDETHPNCP